MSMVRTFLLKHLIIMINMVHEF